MDRRNFYHTAGWIVFCLIAGQARSDEPAVDKTRTIHGIVRELRAGTPNVPVCLCDVETGLPLARETYQPIEWGKTRPDEAALELAIVVSDNRGRFRFANVRDGKYRLVAQKWIGPYQGVFEVHGTVIQLMGVADEIVVPRPKDDSQALVVLTPPGTGIVQFDQDVGNNETFLFLSTSPPEFDPILGHTAMGNSFHQHLIGVNRMPLGKTTVIGTPPQPLYAFFFAADNRPGFATLEVPASRKGLIRMPPEKFVAGWSNGETPPPALAELMAFLDAHDVTIGELLEIPPLSNATYESHRDRMQELSRDLSRKVELPRGKSARVGDLLAVEGYQRLQEGE